MFRESGKSDISALSPLISILSRLYPLYTDVYIVSFTVIKYQLPFFDLTKMLALLTLYFPALIWEVSRKIKAPEEETEYVTYSKLFGYKKAVNFVFIVTWIDIFTNFALVWNLNKWSVLALLLNVLWCSWKFVEFKKNPTKYKIVTKVEMYTYIQESLMILTIILYIIMHR